MSRIALSFILAMLSSTAPAFAQAEEDKTLAQKAMGAAGNVVAGGAEVAFEATIGAKLKAFWAGVVEFIDSMTPDRYPYWLAGILVFLLIVCPLINRGKMKSGLGVLLSFLGGLAVAILLKLLNAPWMGFGFVLTLFVTLIALKPEFRPLALHLFIERWMARIQNSAGELWTLWWNLQLPPLVLPEVGILDPAVVPEPSPEQEPEVIQPQVTPQAPRSPSSTPALCSCGGILGPKFCPKCLKPRPTGGEPPRKPRYTMKRGF